MNKSIKITLQAFIALFIVILFIIWVIPGHSGSISESIEQNITTGDSDETEISAKKEKSSLSAEKIASLFGWKPKQVVVVARKTSPLPVATPEPSIRSSARISFVGTVLTNEEERHYLFKDGRSGRIISLTEGGTDSGWKLESIQQGSYILEYENNKYLVNERN